MGGHKGYAIALMMDVLSGVLIGGAFGPHVVGPYKPHGRSGAGHFIFVLDVARLTPLAEFNARLDELIDGLKRSPFAEGSDAILYPGELEAANDARNRRLGIVLPSDTVGDLMTRSRTYGVAPGFASVAEASTLTSKGAAA